MPYTYVSIEAQPHPDDNGSLCFVGQRRRRSQFSPKQALPCLLWPGLPLWFLLLLMLWCSKSPGKGRIKETIIQSVAPSHPSLSIQMPLLTAPTVLTSFSDVPHYSSPLWFFYLWVPSVFQAHKQSVFRKLSKALSLAQALLHIHT